MNFSNLIGEVTIFGDLPDNKGLNQGDYRRLSDFGLVYVYQGAGVYQDNLGWDFEVQPGSLILLHPEITHHYRAQKGTSWAEVFFLFKGPVFDVWRQAGVFENTAPVTTFLPVEAWTSHFRALLKQMRSGYLKSSETSPYVICELQMIWGRVVAQMESRKDNELTWSQSASQLLRERMLQADVVHTTARELGMGYETFRKKFSAAAGLSPGKYVSQQRVLKAIELLETTDESVAEIASQLGYCDAFYFSRQFAIEVGISPSGHRKTYQQQIKMKYLNNRIEGELHYSR